MWHYALILIDREILLLAGVGLASLFSLWLAGSLAGQVFGDSRLRAAAAGPNGSDAAAEPPAPKSGRSGRRDSEILAIRANAQGGYLRYTDGSYGAAWHGTAPATLLAADESVNEMYRQLALVLNADKPAGTILQVRWTNHLTPASSLQGELAAQAARAGDPRYYAPAQVLRADALQEIINTTSGSGFREGRLTVWCRVPATHEDDGINKLGGFFRRGSGKPGAGGGAAPKLRDPLVRRYLAAEEAAAAACEKVFAGIRQGFPNGGPGPLQRLSQEALWQGVYLGGNERARHAAAQPQNPAGYADVRELLCQEEWQFGPDYVLHGSTPVGVVSLSLPPQPHTHNGIFRWLTQNPGLRFRYTVVVEYIQQDKKKALKKLDKKLFWADKSPKKSPEGLRAEAELKQVRSDLAAPHLRLVTARAYVLVYGPPARSQEELAAAAKILEEQCELILHHLKQLPGADALREDNTALRVLYPQMLPGALKARRTGLEIDEVSPAVATLAPLEGAWRGHQNPHTLLSNASGELFGLNLFDRRSNVGALGLVLGRSGSGKSVFLGKIAADILACVPHACVVAADFGETYAPVVQALGGRQFRFVPEENNTLNIWDYEGLAEGSAPDERQIALVVGDLLHLMGLHHEEEKETRYKGAVCQEVAEAVYRNIVPMNGAGRPRREPTLSDFLDLLANFPYEGTEKGHAEEILTLLKRYRGHRWLDAPTSAVFHGTSRFDVYELDSLELLLADVQSSLAYRVAARIMTRSGAQVDGKFQPLLQMFDEMHKIVEQYPALLRALLRGARQGRKEDTWTLLATHSYRDIEALHGLTANAGLRIIGKQEGDYSDLIRDSRFSPATETAMAQINNAGGGAHQFIVAWDSGPAMQVEIVSVALSPLEYWTFTSHPVERNARQEVRQALLPGEPFINGIAWLGENFPQGLAALGAEAVPPALLEELYRRQAFYYAANPDDAATAEAAARAGAEDSPQWPQLPEPLVELAQLHESHLFLQTRAQAIAAAAGEAIPAWAQARSARRRKPAAPPAARGPE